MSIITWNCQGASNKKFPSIFKSFAINYKAVIFVLVEPRISGSQADKVIKNPHVVKVLTKDGSSITDWEKFRTKSIKMPNGQKKQIHFYKNKETGQIDYETLDYKVKDKIKL